MRGLLVGFGSIGRRHLTNLHELGVDEWTIVHTGKGTLPLEPPCPADVYDDLDTALAETQPDFAVVANPTNLHAETASTCVQAGCPVLLEKPVSASLAETDRLREAVATSGVEVLVGFQFRFHTVLQAIRDLVAGETLGAPLHASVVWGEYLPGWHPWEDYRTGYAARSDLGGGVHHTICHPLDYLRMIFGQPLAVSASLTTQGPLGLDVPEACDAGFRFVGGVRAQLHLDYWARPAVHTFDLTCADGSVSWSFHDGELRTWSTADERWTVEHVPGVAERNDLFLDEARHFLAVVAGTERPVCGLEDGLEVVRMCEAIDWSAAAGGAERDLA